MHTVPGDALGAWESLLDHPQSFSVPVPEASVGEPERTPPSLFHWVDRSLALTVGSGLVVDCR